MDKKTMTASKQVKSRERTRDHGEVYTAEREVKAMLDLVKSESERIDSRFLEPACGNGNFLAEVLVRKLATVKNRYKNSPADYELNAVMAISSIYGVELLQDNVDECINRLFTIFEQSYVAECKKDTHIDCLKTVRYILTRNILCGDALTLKASDDTPIIFSEWTFLPDGKTIRKNYQLSQMLEGHKREHSLLSIAGGWQYDEEIRAYIPKPIREYPTIHYRSIHTYAEHTEL